MEAMGFAGHLTRSDAVLTGEGRFDASSLAGKVVGRVLSAARASGVPVAVLCGEAEVQVEDVDVTSLVETFGAERALGGARQALVELAAEVANRAASVSSPP